MASGALSRAKCAALTTLVLLVWTGGCTSTGLRGRSMAVVPSEISVTELRQRMKQGKAPTLLDVREADERKVSTLRDSLHIPLGELPERLSTLDRSAEIVVFCRSGRRSAQAVELMRASGITRARSLVGGMNAWSQRSGPSAPPPR